jgi:anthranilate phosphoribosyltransferase
MAREILENLMGGKDLDLKTARALMGSIMSGELEHTQIAALLVALRMKGETADEIAGFASAMREKALRISPKRVGLVDTCGTGGDSKHTFNISTAAALLAAAMGIPVAKHGNRAVSSKCGSADVLEALGVNIQLDPPAVAELIDRVGIGFLFAPALHPAMKHVAVARKQLKIRTVFNLLGPLTNPAAVSRQLMGVFNRDLTERMCRVLFRLGSQKAFVVHGQDGTDEVSVTGETQVSELNNQEIRTYSFSPEEVGLERAALEDIAGGCAEENAAHIQDIFKGRDGARRDAVVLNAGFVAHLADKAPDIISGVRLAEETLSSGKAKSLLEQLKKVSHTLGNPEA